MHYYNNLSLDNLTEVNEEGILITEEWCAINEWSGLYEISTFGRVKSLPRLRRNRNGFTKAEARIKSQKKDKEGYLLVELCKDSKSYTHKVHRLVAIAYLPNPENKRTVNHKKGHLFDNRVFELEWATHSENHKHAYRELGRESNKPMLGRYGHSPNSKPVICITTGEVFKSAKSAAKLMNVNKRSILNNCHGKQDMAKGYKFIFA
jgi:hypothetical protein